MPTFNVFDKNCPTRLILDRLSDKWTFLVLDKLAGNTMRFNQLKRNIGGISQKMLSQTLQKLERDGLVQRRAFLTRPVTVEYSLTELGRTLTTTVGHLIHWTENNISAVHFAHNRYDVAARNIPE